MMLLPVCVVLGTGQNIGQDIVKRERKIIDKNIGLGVTVHQWKMGQCKQSLIE